MTTTTSSARPTSSTSPSSTGTAERDDIVALLTRHRDFLLHTTQGLTDDQARLTPTVSTLSLGGLVKHVAATEAAWLDFVEHGAPDRGDHDPEGADEAAYASYADGFRLLPDETLAGVLADYAAVADRAAELARTVDLDAAHPLPEAPWFARESWTNRRVLLHVVAETAQHAGHADIIRETLDGQRTMG